ncbi:MAG: dehydrogenase, partial [Pseudobdellovibrionaceae bacterium]
MKKSYSINEISFGDSKWNCKYEFQMNEKKFQVQRFGADYSIDRMKELIRKSNQEVDAVAVVNLPPTPIFGNQTYIHPYYFEIMKTSTSIPLCCGTILKEILNLKNIVEKIDSQKIDPSQGVFFSSAFFNSEIEEYIRHLPNSKVSFGDLYSIFGLPLSVKPFPGLVQIAKLGMSLLTVQNIKNQSLSFIHKARKFGQKIMNRQIAKYKYAVQDLSLTSYLGDMAKMVEGKEVIICCHHKEMEDYLFSFKPKSIINIFPTEYKFSAYMNHSVLEAAIRLGYDRTAGLSFEEWQDFLAIPAELRSVIRRYALRRKESTQIKFSKILRKIKSFVKNEKPPDFAFIVHALSHSDFERVPFVGAILKMLPERWNTRVDRWIGKIPPIVYGKVRNVVSKFNGHEVNGIIYGLWATPKVLKNQDPERTYAQIQKCCEDAASRGAKIIGLGAYTKVVGDAGVTINRNSPLPVTTGNSLSSSATLWGLYDVVLKMNLLKLDPESKMVLGTAMVIGATGSIGKVSAKLLSLVFKKLIIVAPKLDRLEDLLSELKELSPLCEVVCSVDANTYAGQVDALVTATSSFDQKIIDVMQLKPGCVVCDCS